MTAYLLERLFATGWKRTGELYWRLSDAKREAESQVRKGRARSVRILPVQIGSDAVDSVDPEPVKKRKAANA